MCKTPSQNKERYNRSLLTNSRKSLVKKATIWLYELPLNQTLRLTGKVLQSRKGILLQLTDHKKRIGIGEIAPLPGLHQESLSQCLEQIEEICQHTSITSFMNERKEATSAPTGFIHSSSFSDQPLFPSVQFGLDMADWMLQNQPRNTSLHTPSSRLPVQALITMTDPFWKNKVSQKKQEGWIAFKCKVGRQDLQSEQRQIKEMRDLIGKGSILRLDANRKWELPQARAFCQAIEACQIDLLEEPLKQLIETPKLLGYTNVPIGLDESLHLEPKLSKQLLERHPIAALVLKPSILGGIRPTERWIQLAAQKPCKVIFSSAFESALGRRFLTDWAGRIKQERTPIGMDTASWFQKDLLPKEQSPQASPGYTTSQWPDLSNLFQSELLTHYETYLGIT